VNSTVETLDGDLVKLSVAIGEAEFDQAVDAAFKRIAKEVRLPGFRPGKAPRKILEARLGVEAGRHEAIQEAVPDYYMRALVEHAIDAIDAPKFEVTGGEADGALTFDAVVPVRPRPLISGYDVLHIEIPGPVASDEDVDRQLDALRNQFSTLETVERPAEDGDQVTIDIDGTHDGEAVEGLTTSDYLYEVGVGAVVPEIDENLRGASAGDVVEFDADHPDDEGQLHFRIEVKEVQARVLPDVDDAFAAEASEFDTADELVSDLRQRITDMKRGQAGALARDRVAQAVGELVDLEPPAAMIETEVTQRIQDLSMRLGAQGLELERYLEAMGRDLASLRAEFADGADLAVKVDLGLRAVADAESLGADADQLDDYFAAMAAQFGSTADEVRASFTESGRMLDLEADLRKQAALDWVFERAEIVDEEGEPVDRADLEPPEPELVLPEGDADEDSQKTATDTSEEE